MSIEVFASALVALAGGVIFNPDNLTVSKCNYEGNYTCYRNGDMTLISSVPGADSNYYDFGVIAKKNPIGALDCHNGKFTKFEKFITDYKYEKFNVSRCIFSDYVLYPFLLGQKEIKYLYMDKVSSRTPFVPDFNTFKRKMSENSQNFSDSVIIDTYQFMYSERMRSSDVMKDDLFSGLSNVEHISVVNSEVSIIKNDRFIHQAKLITLDLNNNKITFIEERAFVNLKSLGVLNLQNNKLVSISNWLTHCHNLQIFNASYNSINNINESTFVNLKKLETLDLSHNRLDYSTARKLITKNDSLYVSFINPVHLKVNYLNLSYNIIENIEDSWDTYLQFMELDLSHNNINSFMIDTIRIGIENITINLKHNKLVKLSVIRIDSNIEKQNNIKLFLEGNFIECGCGLNTIVKNLKMNISLYQNISIDIDNSSSCNNPPRLKYQPLKNLTTQMLQCECPTGCSCSLDTTNRVQVVNCFNPYTPIVIPEHPSFPKVALTFRGDYVYNFDSAMVEAPGSIIVALDLSGNSIYNVSSIDIPKNVEILNLRNNFIVHVSEDDVEMLKQHKNMHLYVKNNPIACDCDNWNFISYIKEKDSMETYFIMCDDGKPLYEVSKLICFKKLFIILAGIAILIIILIMLCCWCKYRSKMKRKKKFQVYLAHAPIDSAFVSNKIAPLIQERGLRVLGDDKYFNRGEGTLELISKCDTVVLVISPTFVDVLLSRPELVAILGNLIIERAADVTLVRYEGNLEHVKQLVKCGGSPKDPEYSLRLGIRTVRCYKLEDPEFLDRLPKVKGRGKIKYLKNEEAVQLL